MSNLKSLFIGLLFVILYLQGSAQNPSAEYLYMDSIENDTIAIVEINRVLAGKNLEAKFTHELRIKQLIRYSNLEKFDSTIYWCNKYILEYQNKEKDKLPKLYGMKASAYYYLFNLEKSKESLLQGIQYANETKNGKILSQFYNNLGAIYTEQKQYDLAIKTLKEGLAFNKKYIDSANETYYLTMRILGTTYYINKQPMLADSFFRESIKGLRSIKCTNAIYNGALSFYANFLADQGKHSEAKKLLDEAISISRKDAFQKDHSALFYNIGFFYYGIKDYKNAAIFLDSAFHAQDDDFQRRNTEQLAATETKFKTAILEKDLKISKEIKLKWTYAFLLLLIIAIAGIIANYFNQKKKDANAKLLQNQLAVNAFVNGEEKEKIRLSRELHDGIAQDLLALHFTLKKNGIPEKDLEEITKIGQDIRNLSHELMPLTLKMLGLVPAIEEVCNKILSTATTTYELNVSGLEQRLPQNLEISLYRIFQELAQNIIKHSAATHVIIQIILKNNFVNLIVEDNGKGFDESKKAEGIGLSNLKSRVQMVNGQLNYETSQGEGTTTIVRVPVKL
jgi:signal transduction histidine kinase